MSLGTPFLNVTTIGNLEDPGLLPEPWDSLIRTTVTAVFMALVAELILFVHLLRSNAAAAQVVATNGNMGGSFGAVWELFTNRRNGALRHNYKRRYSLAFLYLLGIGLYHGMNYVVSALLQQTGSRTLYVSELPLELWRVSDQEIEAGFACINKQLTYRNGQSDLQVGMCNFFPIPASFQKECVGIVRREIEPVYGIYYPRMLEDYADLYKESSPSGTSTIGPLVITGNTQLFSSGSLPVLEVLLTEELVRNLFSDMVSGNVTVEGLEYLEFGVGPINKGLGLCGDNVVVTGRRARNKLIGGLGFVPGSSRILDNTGNTTSVLVETSASRTSILTVVYIGAGTGMALLILMGITMFWERITGVSAGVEEILSSAISHAAGSDSALPAAVSNGDVNLKRVNTMIGGRLQLGVYRTDEELMEADEKDHRVQAMLAGTRRDKETYQ